MSIILNHLEIAQGPKALCIFDTLALGFNLNVLQPHQPAPFACQLIMTVGGMVRFLCEICQFRTYHFGVSTLAKKRCHSFYVTDVECIGATTDRIVLKVEKNI